jgi:hypothetical protein
VMMGLLFLQLEAQFVVGQHLCLYIFRKFALSGLMMWGQFIV